MPPKAAVAAILGFLAAVLLFATGAAAQSLPPAPAVRLAVDPIANKVFLADEASDSVTMLDAATGTVTRIPVGPAPRYIAVNPLTGRVYVNNAGDATLTILDSASGANLTPTPLAIGSEGPIAVNAATNVVYVVRLTGTSSDEVTFFNGDTNTWYTIATESFQPISVAVNPVTDTIYVAHYGTGDVRVIGGAFDPSDDFPATTSIPAWSRPFAVAANPVTNRIYVITQDARGPIGIIDGATLAASFPLPEAGHAQGPQGLAVNAVTNKVYALFTGEVVVIDGATNSYTYVPVDTGSSAAEVVVNPATNRIYVAADDGVLTVIDGDTNATSTITIPVGVDAAAANPVTNEVFVGGSGIARLPGAVPAAAADVPLDVSISPLPDDTSGADVTFTLDASSAFAPNAPAIQAVYYRLDDTAGPWTRATGSGPYQASFAGLAAGPHTLHAFAADAQLAPGATGAQDALVGRLRSYSFTTEGSAAISLSSSANPSMWGRAITFTAGISATSGTPGGSVQFRDGSTTIAGCASVAISSGAAACTVSTLAVGSHSITALYSGDAAHPAASSSPLSQSVVAANATVSLASSSNPSATGATVTFTASVAGGSGTPTGSVDFVEGGSILAGCEAVALTMGSASCSTSSLAAGTHAIAARYSGNAGYAPATSQTLDQQVQDAPVLSVSVAPASLDFGGQSMGTVSPPLQVTVTNTGSATVNVGTVSTSDAQFSASSACASLAPGASCQVAVTFAPAPAPGDVASSAAVDAALSIASDAAGSPATVPLHGVAEKTLVTHFYLSILRREPDEGGKAFWQSQATRMVGLGANVNETWFAMAAAFFASPEYAAFGRDDAGFVTDLYQTFFNRAPDSGGLAFWTGQLANGMPREVALASFMFSPEFAAFTQAIYGNTAARAEVDTVMDFYRGILGRLPDDAGFDFWVQRFRAAQCQGAAAVAAEADSISASFAGGAEYANRGRGNAQYVGDLYNAILRRGGDGDGVRFWVGQLDSGAQTRDQVRRAFLSTPEFGDRVSSIVAQGCMQ